MPNKKLRRHNTACPSLYPNSGVLPKGKLRLTSRFFRFKKVFLTPLQNEERNKKGKSLSKIDLIFNSESNKGRNKMILNCCVHNGLGAEYVNDSKVRAKSITTRKAAKRACTQLEKKQAIPVRKIKWVDASAGK
eukprot:TRINITY_DN7514_c0_g1_i10.p1 TRINITY_DN7514_c0_g1~~TRINITY_DN7514_c0_g1_i10.p1  ORF type:complete len:134 (-),score=17.03 TRINITY_DN7514_c0_g1_i10:94-495(-)